VSVNNDNIYYNVYGFYTIHREHSVLVHYNFYNVLLATYLTLKLPRNSNGLN